jgi:hypothetical protein
VHAVVTLGTQDTPRIELALPPGVSVTVVGVKVRDGAPVVGATVLRRERVPLKPPRLVTVIVSGTTAPIGTLIEERVEATLKLQTLMVTFARVPKYVVPTSPKPATNAVGSLKPSIRIV